MTPFIVENLRLSRRAKTKIIPINKIEKLKGMFADGHSTLSISRLIGERQCDVKTTLLKLGLKYAPKAHESKRTIAAEPIEPLPPLSSDNHPFKICLYHNKMYRNFNHIKGVWHYKGLPLRNMKDWTPVVRELNAIYKAEGRPQFDKRPEWVV